jgi:hypothetical protein
MPLEGLWWTDNMSSRFSPEDKLHWRWTLMIMQPDFVTKEIVAAKFIFERHQEN